MAAAAATILNSDYHGEQTAGFPRTITGSAYRWLPATSCALNGGILAHGDAWTTVPTQFNKPLHPHLHFTPKAGYPCGGMATAKTAKKKEPKGKTTPITEPGPHNINAIGTLLTNSYGKQALTLVNEDGPVFGVVRDALTDQIKKQWQGELFELWAGLDEDENVFVCAFIDFEIKGVDPQKLALALGEVTREIGLCYGSFGSLDAKHVTFVVGLPGSSDNAVPATMLADTIAYALNAAATAKEHLNRVFAAAKSRKRA